jgi:hypothetical protein
MKEWMGIGLSLKPSMYPTVAYIVFTYVRQILSKGSAEVRGDSKALIIQFSAISHIGRTQLPYLVYLL